MTGPGYRIEIDPRDEEAIEALSVLVDALPCRVDPDVMRAVVVLSRYIGHVTADRMIVLSDDPPRVEV